MKPVSKLDEVESIFFEDLMDDYEGLWRLARMVKDALGTDEPEAVREVTLKLLGEWLSEGLIRSGVPHGYDSGFDSWPEQGEAAAERISAEWHELDRMPLLGDIAWFDITPKGERLVRERLAVERPPGV